MATGDQADILARVKALLPRWFGTDSPILNALLQGFAWAMALVYSQIIYAKAQLRIKTATDGWLDLLAWDFFGGALVRTTNQTDASLSAKIVYTMFRERATRNAIVKVLTDLTGRTPKIFEPSRPADTGGWNSSQSLAYGLAGGYGSLALPNQAFIIAYRPAGTGVPYVAGYGNPEGAWNTPSQIEYVSASMVQGAVQDADIYAAVDSVKPVGSEMWVQISN